MRKKRRNIIVNEKEMNVICDRQEEWNSKSTVAKAHDHFERTISTIEGIPGGGALLSSAVFVLKEKLEYICKRNVAYDGIEYGFMRGVTPVMAVVNTTAGLPEYCFKTEGEEFLVEGFPGYMKSHPSLVNRNNTDDSTQYDQENQKPEEKENQKPEETVISIAPVISGEKDSPLRRASVLTPENLVELGNLLKEMTKITKN